MRKTPHYHYIPTSPNINTQKGIGLQDLMVRRQGELSLLLTGCACINPVGVLPIIKRLNPADITDEYARRYLDELRWRLVDLESADADKRAQIVVEVAIKCGCEVEYLRWLTLLLPGITAEEQAEQAIQEIKELVISRRAIAGISDYALRAEGVSRWGNHGNYYASQ